MTLPAGTRLGPYEIASPIGAGGMGEVYRAVDTTLGRQVAIKILPETFAHDAERLARFEREARTLAALNHPNIAQIYGLERSEVVVSGFSRTIPALVLELVEGPTLADRIAAGRIPVDETLAIARQIVDALEAAHEHGIVHRDLKPANIKVREDGTVKVLDFGLAKLAQAPGPGPQAPDFTASPTITSPAMTQLGVILGTAAYMSPEQARGKAVDKRADIWAFGCVLFEMLTGRRAFEGDDVSDTLAAVLRAEPDWSKVPPSIPRTLVRLAKRCLQKDRAKRLRDIADARLDVEEALTAPLEESRTAAASTRISFVRRLLPYAAVAVGSAAAAAYAVWMRQPAIEQPVVRVAISLPADQQFPAFNNRRVLALSPAGTHLTYVANSRLYLRALDQLEAVALRGTEAPSNAPDAGPRNPFFAPDGQSIGFWQGGQLKKVSVSGGAPITLCDAEIPWGAMWGADDTILYGQGEKGIWSVPSAGGVPTLIIPVEAGEQAYGPQALPGGDWVMFTLLPKGAASWNDAQIVAQSLKSSQRRVLIKGGRDAHYLTTGHLLYGLKGNLLVVPFDSARLDVAGGPVPLVEGIASAISTGALQFAVGEDGTLAYVSARAGINKGTPVWVSGEGRELAALSSNTLSNPLFPRLSPDGRRLALAIDGDLWVYDVEGRATDQADVSDHRPCSRMGA